MQAIWFGLAIFVGWLIIDWTKEKSINSEQVLHSVVAGVIGAVGWALLEWIF